MRQRASLTATRAAARLRATTVGSCRDRRAGAGPLDRQSRLAIHDQAAQLALTRIHFRQRMPTRAARRRSRLRWGSLRSLLAVWRALGSAEGRQGTACQVRPHESRGEVTAQPADAAQRQPIGFAGPGFRRQKRGLPPTGPRKSSSKKVRASDKASLVYSWRRERGPAAAHTATRAAADARESQSSSLSRTSARSASPGSSKTRAQRAAQHQRTRTVYVTLTLARLATGTSKVKVLASLRVAG